MSNLRQSKTDEEWNKLSNFSPIMKYGDIGVQLVMARPSTGFIRTVDSAIDVKNKIKIVYKHSEFKERSICVAAVIHTRIVNKKPIGRSLALGYSIKNPIDKQDKNIAEKIALGRCNAKPSGIIKSDNLVLLNLDIVDVLMNKLIDDIKERPFKYIAGYKAE